jgi:FtsH-binding integral membrane protein
MASLTQTVPVRVFPSRKGVVEEYFYFAMSLLIAAIVVTSFSRTVNQNLFHAAIPRPFLLWIHAAAFSSWICFYILQSALVRSHNVKLHRQLGWIGVGLGALMVPLGFTIAIIMGRFDTHQVHQYDPTFLSIPFYDMIAFGTLLSLAIYWRRKPSLHRPLLFMATCGLLDAAFGRFDFIFDHYLFFPCLDFVILLGVIRDLMVNRRVNVVYRYALPVLIVGQAFTVYLWHWSPAWWLRTTQAILG